VPQIILWSSSEKLIGIQSLASLER